MDTSKLPQIIKTINPWTRKEMDLRLEFNTYANGGIFLQFYSKDEDGFEEPWSTASVCVPGLLDDEIAIKCYGENDPNTLNLLVENNVVTPPHRYVSSGMVVIPVCKLMPEGKHNIYCPDDDEWYCFGKDISFYKFTVKVEAARIINVIGKSPEDALKNLQYDTDNFIQENELVRGFIKIYDKENKFVSECNIDNLKWESLDNK